MKKTITILTMITLITGVLGCLWSYDKSKADAADLMVIRAQIQHLQVAFTEAEKRRRANDIEQRIWTLEDRFEGRQLTQSVKEELRRLKKELKELRGDK